MPACSFSQVANWSEWKILRNDQYKSSEIVFKDKDPLSDESILINERNEEVSSEYGGRQFQVLAIALEDRSVAARICRAVIGIILATASLGISLCFEGGRDLFSRKFAVVISMPLNGETTDFNRLTVLEKCEDEAEQDPDYPPSAFYKVEFIKTEFGNRSRYVGRVLSAVVIRDIMNRIPEENFEGDRSAFQNVRFPLIQHRIQQALNQ